MNDEFGTEASAVDPAWDMLRANDPATAGASPDLAAITQFLYTIMSCGSLISDGTLILDLPWGAYVTVPSTVGSACCSANLVSLTRSNNTLVRVDSSMSGYSPNTNEASSEIFSLKLEPAVPGGAPSPCVNPLSSTDCASGESNRNFPFLSSPYKAIEAVSVSTGSPVGIATPVVFSGGVIPLKSRP